MKILFVINSGSKKAAGGHYRSLIEVAAKIANECEVLILNYGVKLSPVVESSQLNFVFEEVKNNDIKSAIDIIHSYAKSFKPTHIHAFDFASFYTSRIVAKKNRLPIIVNKCGGNSWGYYASCSHYIFFTEEDKNALARQKPKHPVSVIPNRVAKFSCDSEIINEVKSKHEIGENDTVILRIGRISHYYEKITKNTIKFIEEQAKNKNIVLILVGTVEDAYILDELKSKTFKWIHLEDPKYTNDAKKLLDIAHLAVGTGRGAMEAFCRGKKVLVASKNTNDLVLLNKENFDLSFKFNFSERIPFETSDIDHSDYLISELFSKEDFSNNQFELESFTNHFSTEKVQKKYIQVYRKARFKDSFFTVDFLLHSISAFKSSTIKKMKSFIKRKGR